MGYEVSIASNDCLMAIEMMLVIRRDLEINLKSSEVSLFLN